MELIEIRYFRHLTGYSQGESDIIETCFWMRGVSPSHMRQPTAPLINLKSRSGQVLPSALFGAILFLGISNTHLNQFFSAYLILLAAQLGTLGIYLLSRRLKTRASIHADLKGRQN